MGLGVVSADCRCWGALNPEGQSGRNCSLVDSGGCRLGGVSTGRSTSRGREGPTALA